MRFPSAAWFASFVVAGFFAVGLRASEAGSSYHIEEIGVEIAAEKTPDGRSASNAPPSLVLFDATRNRLRGWSHLAEHPEQFSPPRFASAEYAIAEGDGTNVFPAVAASGVAGSVSAAVGSGAREFRAILVKRLADWDRQHLNGIEPVFADAAIPVRDFDAIVLEVRFDSARSSLPAPELLASRYGKFLSAGQLAALDNGRAHLGISVFESGYNEHDRSILNAAAIVEFDPARHFDRWLRVTIPAEALAWFFERNYARSPTDRAAQLERALVGLRLNPETRTGLTVRHSLREAFGPQVPETLKEMAFAIRRLEIRRRTP